MPGRAHVSIWTNKPWGQRRKGNAVGSGASHSLCIWFPFIQKQNRTSQNSWCPPKKKKKHIQVIRLTRPWPWFHPWDLHFFLWTKGLLHSIQLHRGIASKMSRCFAMRSAYTRSIRWKNGVTEVTIDSIYDMYIFLYIHEYIYICIYDIFLYIHEYIYIYIYVYMIYFYTYMNIYVYICIWLYLYVKVEHGASLKLWITIFDR